MEGYKQLADEDIYKDVEGFQDDLLSDLVEKSNSIFLK